MEYSNKIGFLVEPNVQFSNKEHYENMMKETIKENAIEYQLSRRFVHKQGKNQNSL